MIDKIINVTVDVPTYEVTVTEDKGYTVTIDTESDIMIDCEYAIIQGYGADYEGSYTAIPKAHSQTILPTNGKTLADNITVQQIPYFETSNPNGKTVFIANEV